MQAKGFYKGKIDGVWGPKSIAAKQKWERSGKFAPAIPNNGFPLNDRASLPPGVIRQANGLLTCEELKNKPAQAAAPQPVVSVVNTPVQVSTTSDEGGNKNNQSKK